MFKHYYWWLPFCFYSAEANAWGLVTHVYFAHSLLWAMPLLDPRLQRAIKKFPELVMTGACLPDLAVVSSRFSDTHQWQRAHHLLDSAETDAETALAIGYASHLYVDVIAHNHFVPAHEASWFQRFKRDQDFIRNQWLKQTIKQHFKLEKWFNHSAMTHLACEWAMDAHLSKLAPQSPSQLLSAHQTIVINYVAKHFNCTQAESVKAVKRLTFWDNILRRLKFPHIVYVTAKVFDRQLFKHFVYYIAKTQNAMADIGQALAGHTPSLAAERKDSDQSASQSWGKACLGDLHLLHPRPIVYFSAGQQALTENQH